MGNYSAEGYGGGGVAIIFLILILLLLGFPGLYSKNK